MTSRGDAAPGDESPGASGTGADAATEPADTGDRSLERRRVLALTGAVAAGGLAGCGGDGGSDDATTEPTTEETTTEPTTETTEPTTTGPTAESTTTTEGPITDSDDLVWLPVSEIEPTAGFASAEWLAETDPQIVKVTNLDAEGEGSLRAALETEGPRIVVFEVGGVIDLRDGATVEIEPGQGDIFVAGQTAPSPGITIVRGSVVVSAENVLIQHLRVRPGDDIPAPTDALSVGETGKNVIFDHCSVSWGTDENMSTGGSEENHTVTFSNNVIAEGLANSIHPEGEHSMGTLVMDDASNVAILGNLYAYNGGRNPRLKGGTSSAVVNNYVFHVDGGTGIGAGSDALTATSIVGNRWERGPDNFLVGDFSTGESQIYLDDNEVVYYENGVQTEYPGSIAGDSVEPVDEPPVWPGDFIAPPVGDVAEINLATAGARPADRTPHDQRVIDNVRNREGSIIDSQEEVGGYPDLEATERSLDVPEYGQAFAVWLAWHTRAVELGEEPP